jgi:hypothetical protein
MPKGSTASSAIAVASPAGAAAFRAFLPSVLFVLFVSSVFALYLGSAKAISDASGPLLVAMTTN